MREMTLETFYIINQIPKINRTHWNLPWMSCILKFRSLKISLEPLERSFHREEKTEICRQASWDIWNSPFGPGFRRERNARGARETLAFLACPKLPFPSPPNACHAGYRRSKGKGKGIRTRDHARARREEGNDWKQAIVFAIPPTN